MVLEYMYLVRNLLVLVNHGAKIEEMKTARLCWRNQRATTTTMAVLCEKLLMNMPKKAK